MFGGFKPLLFFRILKRQSVQKSPLIEIILQFFLNEADVKFCKLLEYLSKDIVTMKGYRRDQIEISRTGSLLEAHADVFLQS